MLTPAVGPRAKAASHVGKHRRAFLNFGHRDSDWMWQASPAPCFYGALQLPYDTVKLLVYEPSITSKPLQYTVN